MGTYMEPQDTAKELARITEQCESGYFVIDDLLLFDYSSEQLKEMERILLQEAKERGLLIMIEHDVPGLLGRRRLKWKPICYRSREHGNEVIATSACYNIGACGCRVVKP